MEYDLGAYEIWVITKDWEEKLLNKPTEQDFAAFKSVCKRKDLDPSSIARSMGIYSLNPFDESATAYTTLAVEEPFEINRRRMWSLTNTRGRLEPVNHPVIQF